MSILRLDRALLKAGESRSTHLQLLININSPIKVLSGARTIEPSSMKMFRRNSSSAAPTNQYPSHYINEL